MRKFSKLVYSCRMMRTLLFLLALLPPLAAYLPYAQRGMPLYYWDARDADCFENFGDVLSEKIVERLAGHRVNTTHNPKLMQRKVLALGSIIQMAKEADIVWGSGVNGKVLDKEAYNFKYLDVRAVRGPLTRQFLLELGLRCPKTYGDPALLIAQLFPEFKKKPQPRRDYIIIPHVSEEHFFAGDPHVVSCREDWDYVIEQILDSRFVISTSLHGIVVAESFGIPARYLKVSDSEPLFKYLDYYQGTGRADFQIASTVEEALKLGGEPPHRCNLKKLMQAFPFDCFK